MKSVGNKALEPIVQKIKGFFNVYLAKTDW